MKTNQLDMRNLLLYVSGSTVSQIGSVIYSFAIGLYVLNKTGSGFSFATTLALGMIPTVLLSPFAGVLADRMDRKKIVVGMDILNGLLFVGLFSLLQMVSLNLIIIYATTFLANLFSTFCGIAFESSKPQLVSDEKLTLINSLSQIIMAFTNVLGPILGGIVYALMDIKLFILFNGISFIVSAFTGLCTNFNLNKKTTQNVKNNDKVLKSMSEGFTYLLKDNYLISLMGIFLIMNIAFSMSIIVPLPYILNNFLSLSPRLYGMINGLLPVGMIFGAIFVGGIVRKLGFHKLLYCLLVGASSIMILFGLPRFMHWIELKPVTITLYFGTLLGLMGFVISMIDVPIMTFLQSRTEEHYRGRVLGIIMTIIKAINPIAYILAGVLLDHTNPYLLPLVGGFLALGLVLLNRKIILKEPDGSIKMEAQTIM